MPWGIRLWWLRRLPKPPLCNTWPRTAGVPWASISGTAVVTPSSSMMTWVSKPWRTGKCLCCWGDRLGVKPTRETSSTCTPVYLSVLLRWAMPWVVAPWPPCPSSKPRVVTLVRTSPPTSFQSPMARSFWSPSSSSKVPQNPFGSINFSFICPL